MQRIPITNDADQIFTTTLAGQVVRIRATWQDEGNSWFLSLLTPTEVFIFANTRIKSNIPVVNFKLIDFEGDFIAIPVDVTALEPGRNAWGSTHELYHLNTGEAEQVRDALIEFGTEPVILNNFTDFFQLDGSNGIQPVSTFPDKIVVGAFWNLSIDDLSNTVNPVFDNFFELDINGDIQPKD